MSVWVYMYYSIMAISNSISNGLHTLLMTKLVLAAFGNEVCLYGRLLLPPQPIYLP